MVAPGSHRAAGRPDRRDAEPARGDPAPASWTERASAAATLDPGLLQQLWRNAGAAYGIPWNVLAAINKIESNLGRNMGPSSAGAVGWMQFMPDTWLRWGHGRERRRRRRSLGPGGRGLRRGPLPRSRGRARRPPPCRLRLQPRRLVRQRRARAGGELRARRRPARRSPSTEPPSTSRRRASVQASVGDRLNAALAAERRSRGRRRAARCGAVLATCSPSASRASGERRSAGVERERAQRRVEALRRELARGRAGARGGARRCRSRRPSRSRARRCSATRATPATTSSPSAAAPRPCPWRPTTTTTRRPTSPPRPARRSTRSPTRSSSTLARPRSRCGIGATMRTQTGSSWTYCHLSYLDPTSRPGRCSRRARSSASSAPPGTAPGRTSTCSCSRPTLTRSRGLVPGLRRHRLHLAGRSGGRRLHGSAPAEPHRVFSVVSGRGAAERTTTGSCCSPADGVNPRPRPADGVTHAFPAACRSCRGFLAIVVVCVLANRRDLRRGERRDPPAAPAPATPVEPTALVVPDVRDQAYVFAKGTLEDAGFAWKLEGGAPGYAANVVVRQSPRPGTRVVDTGAPLISLQLAANASYRQRAQPENASPVRRHVARARRPAEPAPAPAATPAPRGQAEARRKPKPAAKPKPVASRRPSPRRASPPPRSRPPAARVHVPGAPAEPLDEISAARPREAPRRLRHDPSEARATRPRATGCTSTRGSSPAPSSAGGRAPRRSRCSSPSTGRSSGSGAWARRAGASPSRRSRRCGRSRDVTSPDSPTSGLLPVEMLR